MNRKQPSKPSPTDHHGGLHDLPGAKPRKQSRRASSASPTDHARAGDNSRPKGKAKKASASKPRKTTNASKARQPQRGDDSMANAKPASASSHADRKARKAARRLESPLRPGFSRKGTRYFVQGPVPLDWLERASTCGRKGLNVGLAIWWLAGVKKKSTVTLTREALEHFRVTPTAAVRILRKMEAIHLCQVQTKRGRGPRVTLG